MKVTRTYECYYCGDISTTEAKAVHRCMKQMVRFDKGKYLYSQSTKKITVLHLMPEMTHRDGMPVFCFYHMWSTLLNYITEEVKEKEV